MKTNCIFLDNNSSTELDPRVLNKYIDALQQTTGNSSSKHFFGWKSHALYEVARDNISKLFCTTPDCVVFTSGATEANNIALLGLREKTSYVSSNIEHSSVFETLNKLAEDKVEVNFLEVSSKGIALKNEPLIEKAGLISIHHANNEIGVVENYLDFVKSKNSILHSDASQSVGKLQITFESHPVDVITLSGHKIHAPKGIGALLFRSVEVKKKFNPILFGGHHDEDLRPGTIPVALCLALSEALTLAVEELPTTTKLLRHLVDKFYAELSAGIKDIQLVGPKDFSMRLPGLLSVSFPDINSSELISTLANSVAFSSGSACRVSKSRVATEVLKNQKLVDGFARFGISKFTTEEELVKAAKLIINEHQRLSKRNG